MQSKYTLEQVCTSRTQIVTMVGTCRESSQGKFETSTSLKAAVKLARILSVAACFLNFAEMELIVP